MCVSAKSLQLCPTLRPHGSVGLLNWIQQKCLKSVAPEVQGKALIGNTLSQAVNQLLPTPFQVVRVSVSYQRKWPLWRMPPGRTRISNREA